MKKDVEGMVEMEILDVPVIFELSMLLSCDNIGESSSAAFATCLTLAVGSFSKCHVGLMIQRNYFH